jgi:hypothetical protein
VATTIGTTYDLSFFYDSGQDPTFGSELLVLFGDPTAPSISSVVDLVDVDSSGAYVQYTGTVVATSLTSQLEFLGRQDLDFYYLDDVSLTPSVTGMPEPQSALLIASGAVLLGGLHRCRQDGGTLTVGWIVVSRTVASSS